MTRQRQAVAPAYAVMASQPAVLHAPLRLAPLLCRAAGDWSTAWDIFEGVLPVRGVPFLYCMRLRALERVPPDGPQHRSRWPPSLR